MRTITLFILFFISKTSAWTQPQIALNSTHYTIDNGVMTSPVFDIIKDAQGFMWFSSRVGTQRFDGSVFHNIPAGTDKQGILDNQSTSFLNLKNGKLLISHSKGISLFDSKTNTFDNHYLSLNNHILKSRLTPLCENIEHSEIPNPFGTEGCVWFLKNYDKPSLVLFDLKTFKEKEQIKLNEQYYTDNQYFIDTKNNIFYSDIMGTLIKVDLTSKQITQRLPIDFSIKGLHPLDDDNLLVFCEKGWRMWQHKTNKLTPINSYPNNHEFLSKGIPVSVKKRSMNKLVMAANNQLWEFDLAKKAFTASYVNREMKPFFENGYYSQIFTDDKNNIWLATNLNGLFRVNSLNRLIKYYGTPDRKMNFSKCLLVDKKCNRVISGTYGHGIFLFDTLQNLIKHIPLIDKEIGENIVTTFMDFNDKYCLFFLLGSSKFYLLNKKTGDVLVANNWLNFSNNMRSMGYYSMLISESDTSFIYPSSGYIFRFNIKNNQFYFKDSTYFYKTHSGVTLKNKQIVLGGTDSIYTFKNNKIQAQQFIGKTTVKSIAEDKKGSLWVATEHKLIEMTPPLMQAQYPNENHTFQIKKEWTTENGLPDNNIYAVTVDKKNHVWFSHNKGISVINGSIRNLTVADGLQDNEFNTAAVTQTPDGELFFGGVNGISSFYPDDILTLIDTPAVFLNGLTVMGEPFLSDSALWNLDKIELPYNQNVLNFDYSALGLYATEHYNFQVKMDGFDPKWVNMLNQKTIRYQLNAGTYRLDLFASRSFDPNAKPLKSILITVHPPLWKRWWFIFLSVIAFGTFVWQLVRYQFRKKYKAKLSELATQKRIHQEKVRISRDLHDNLGAQLSHIVRSAEWLSTHKNGEKSVEKTEEKTLLEGINESAKQSMTTLRDSIWTLNKEHITVEDFVERFKKFAQHQVKSSPQISLKIKEKIQKNNTLSPEQSLQIYRILQEALNNALKYANATEINITLQSTDNQLITCEIKDNGIGFDVEAAQNKGNGLENMTRRAEGIGAEFNIESNGKKGTVVSCQL
jgi:signal transduction histidine kinase